MSCGQLRTHLPGLPGGYAEWTTHLGEVRSPPRQVCMFLLPLLRADHFCTLHQEAELSPEVESQVKTVGTFCTGDHQCCPGQTASATRQRDEACFPFVEDNRDVL